MAEQYFDFSQSGATLQERINQIPNIVAALENIQRVIASFLDEEQVQSLINTSLEAYSTTADMNAAINTAIADYYTKNQIDIRLADYSTTVQMNTAIRTALEAALAAYSTTEDMNAAIEAALANYYTKAEMDTFIEAIQADITALKNGTIPAKLADNLTSWAERGETPQSGEWSNLVRTTAGDMSVDSGEPAKLLSITPKTSEFYARRLRATGFNLLRNAQAAGSGYYFEVPALTFGTLGTADENNGVLFTDVNGDNLRPTVYFKPLTEGVPQHANDGTECQFTDAGGYRFYTCEEPGYLIVSNITLGDTCAHIGWSRRYNEYIGIGAQGDAGSTLALAELINAVHDFNLLLRVNRGEESAFDEIRFGTDTANWYRRVGRVKPTWNTQDNGDETYTHTATIEGMKSNGIAQCGQLALTISGTTISYTDDQSAATADYVLYQLATPASGSVAFDSNYTIEDWGLELLEDATGEAYVTSQYYQSLPDAVAALLSKVPQLRQDLTTETETRVQNEKQIRLDLEAEENRARGAEQTLQQNINSEAQTRQQADAAINAKIPQAASSSNLLVDRQYLAEQIALEVQARLGADADLQALIDAIVAKIPAAATAQNQLADMEFVNSSIASNTGSLVTDNGQPFNSVADLEAYSGTLHNNDYAFVVTTDGGNTVYNRYKYNATTQQWAFEYALNNSSFTAAQFAAINSGITATLVTKLGDLPNATELAQQISTAITNALVSYYTKTDIDTLIASYYTKTQIDTLIANYSTTTEMGQAIGNALASYYTKTDIDSLIAGYYTKQQVDSAISSAIQTALGSYYTKTEIDSLLAGYATTGALSSHTGNTTVHITAAERTAWNAKQNAITDGAQIGLGYGTSSDTATTQARTATIASFLLLKNMPVTVRFTTAVNVSGATLNISSTGAKPIFIQGAAMQPGIIKKDDVVTMIYDGTNWNIVEILSVATAKSDLVVDMGLPSGRLWAIANIDMTTQSGFAEVDGVPSPYKYECTFFSWGNTEGHNPSSTSAFSYDWGSGNDGPYASTPGAALTADAGLSFDAARAILGGPWRDPSTDDFAELFNSAYTKFIDANGDDIAAETTNKLVTISGIVGIRLKSIANGNIIFFPCCGDGYGQGWFSRGSVGNYWSRSLYSQTVGRNLRFGSGGVNPQDGNNRFYGFTRRAVQ